jgi:regulator of protease activity HflC (stomatin/prohibitin superfamily)
VIEPGNVGVVFNKMTGSLHTATQGLVGKVPFVTSVQSYPVSLRTYTMVQRGGEGSSEGDDSIDLPTKQGQHIRQDISVTYNTSEDKAAEVYRRFKGDNIGDIEATFIRRTIITVAQNLSGQMDLSELISTGRDKLQTEIENTLRTELDKAGFHLDKVNLGASHLPAAIEEQMQNKMRAQQEAMQAEYTLQKEQTMAKAAVAKAQGEADAKVVLAEGQAQANRKLQLSLTPMLIEYKKIETWNGELPQVTGGTPIISLGGSFGKTNSEK